MRRLFIASVALAALMAAPVLAQDDPMPESIESAVSDASRPETDRQLDAARHPAEVLLFAGVEPGWRVADMAAGGGYYSRVLSTAVGTSGHVYTMNPTWVAEDFAETDAALAAIAAERANMTHFSAPMESFGDNIDLPLDAVFMVLFYHDTAWDGTDRAAMNREIFDSLRPGGVFVVIDHHAVAGTGLEAVESLHRIDEAAVIEEISAAGFELEASSAMLANAEDAREISVFDPSIRRHTDRFVLRFRKPD
ncbi:class I SAM-dependent methyltransferase [Maricaulis maris]|jgi:predicted methyltransferase|uniref:class I SAM-dependent methyltransferase n=1 Tax=Maricaulis maris TaxID=74318 RepID=UPI00291D52FB|nr:methyltransferase [Maricaulis maris]